MLTTHPVSGVVSMKKTEFTPPDYLRTAVETALASGVSENEILSMVSSATADYFEPELPGFEHPGLPIYDELPAGLIDLVTAADRYERSNKVLRAWIYRGHLKALGRLRGRGRNGGSLVVCEQDLVKRINAPRNKGGRPRKLVAK